MRTNAGNKRAMEGAPVTRVIAILDKTRFLSRMGQKSIWTYFFEVMYGKIQGPVS